MRKEIKCGDKVLAVIFGKNLQTDSIEFLTPVEYPLQVGLLQHKGGKFVPLHFHNNFHYKVDTTHEILYVEHGRCEIVITDFDWNPIETVVLTDGDMALLMDGGHSVKFDEDTRVWEIKQGPYPGDKLAKVFKDDWNGSIPENRLHEI